MKELPVASSEPETRAPDAPSPLPPREEASGVRLVATLAVAGGLAGLLIFFVFRWADPRIQAHRAEVLQAAVLEVLGEPDHFDALWVYDGRLVKEAPSGADTTALEKVFLGYDAAGSPVGFAIPGAEPGFQDVVRLIFGYDVRERKVLGMRVLESKETPGLGDRIIKDSAFVAGFEGPSAPLKGVKQGAGRGDPEEVDMITGATISSRAVIGIINHRLEALQPVLESYMADARTPERPGAPKSLASRNGGGS